jgi:hypothetical protein
MGVLTVCMTPACLRLVDVKLKHPTGIEPASNQQESSFKDVGYPVLITALAVKTTSHSIEPYGKRAQRAASRSTRQSPQRPTHVIVFEHLAATCEVSILKCPFSLGTLE